MFLLVFEGVGVGFCCEYMDVFCFVREREREGRENKNSSCRAGIALSESPSSGTLRLIKKCFSISRPSATLGDSRVCSSFEQCFIVEKIGPMIAHAHFQSCLPTTRGRDRVVFSFCPLSMLSTSSAFLSWEICGSGLQTRLQAASTSKLWHKGRGNQPEERFLSLSALQIVGWMIFPSCCFTYRRMNGYFNTSNYKLRISVVQCCYISLPTVASICCQGMAPSQAASR